MTHPRPLKNVCIFSAIEIYPILDYIINRKIRIAHIDGTGTVGQVHDRIEAELEACSLV